MIKMKNWVGGLMDTTKRCPMHACEIIERKNTRLEVFSTFNTRYFKVFVYSIQIII